MPELVSAYQDNDGGNTVVTVSKELADSLGLTVLKSDPATDKHGRPRGPREGNRKKTSAANPASATNPTGGQSASTPEEASK